MFETITIIPAYPAFGTYPYISFAVLEHTVNHIADSTLNLFESEIGNSECMECAQQEKRAVSDDFHQPHTLNVMKPFETLQGKDKIKYSFRKLSYRYS
jgi:hypothetical protein